MDKKQVEADLAEKKKELKEAQEHYNKEEEFDSGPYAEVEIREEIRQLEIEVDSLEEKLKDL